MDPQGRIYAGQMDYFKVRAAIAAKANVLLTDDKDFLESGLENPRIMTPAEFLNME